MASQKKRYEELCLLSLRMVDAARVGNWGELTELERRVDSFRIFEEAVTTQTFNLACKRDLTLQILAADAEVRRLTEPWMEKINRYLGEQDRDGIAGETTIEPRGGQGSSLAALT